MAYVICRILSGEGSAYAPKNRGDGIINQVIGEDKKLLKDVEAFVRHQFGIMPTVFHNNILHYPGYNFRRKCTDRDPHWFYYHIHKYLEITGFNVNKDAANSASVFATPADFSWKLTKREKKEKKK